MNEFCHSCTICCRLIPVIDGKMLRDGFCDLPDNYISVPLEEAIKMNESYVKKVHDIFPNAKFFRCSNLSQNNKCELENFPQSCSVYPENAMAIVPDECYYSGEIFIKKEELKHKVRKYKEEMLYHQTHINPDDKDSAAHEKIIRSLSRFVDKYKPFGSDNW